MNRLDPQEFTKIFVGAISTLIVSFLLGTAGMIYSSHTTNEVFKAQLEAITEKMREIKADLKEMNNRNETRFEDRWTRTDHVHYDKNVQRRFDLIFKRLRNVEVKTNTQPVDE